MMVLKRARSQASAELHLFSRSSEEKELALSFDAGRWSVLGQLGDMVLTRERQQIIDFLTTERGNHSVKDIAAFTGKTYQATWYLLKKMHERGIVGKSRGNRYYALKGHSPLEVQGVKQDQPLNGSQRALEVP